MDDEVLIHLIKTTQVKGSVSGVARPSSDHDTDRSFEFGILVGRYRALAELLEQVEKRIKGEDRDEDEDFDKR